MSRIIAGLAGSIKLKTASKATRPTSDRVKESVFAKLESLDAIAGARVLDLYAGTGALGLEAASRGANEVVLVDKDRSAVEVIKANMQQVTKSLAATTQVTVETTDALKFLQKNQTAFDLVFIDPPYEVSNEQVLLVLDGLEQWVGPEGLVVIERSSRGMPLVVSSCWEQLELKTYGDTVVYFLEVSK